MIRRFPIPFGGGVSPVSGELIPYIDLDPSNFAMDTADIGVNFGSGFSGLVSSIDFSPDTQGTAWTHFNFKSSEFDSTKDMFFDLHWIADGTIASSQAVRITVKAWVVATEGTPVAASPTLVQTTNITVDSTKTGKKMMSGAFLTLAEASIPTTCETILLSVTREAVHADDTYTGTFQLINLVARQAVLSSGLIPYIGLGPLDFTMDVTDVGADFGSGFSGLVSSVDFVPDTQGTTWTHFNFKSSEFDSTKDILFDLHWIANGAIASPQAVRITVKAWVVATEGIPVASSPTFTQTTNITVDSTKTGKKLMSGAFLTLAEASIPTTCESILLSVTREAVHADDTYTGTFQLINLVARQA